jgi:hypothetical protein
MHPPGTRRCFNVEIWLKKGRDVDNLKVHTHRTKPDTIRQRDAIFRSVSVTDNFDSSLNFTNISKRCNILSYLVYISFKICFINFQKLKNRVGLSNRVRCVWTLISTLLWRCFTNVGSTAANRRRINVRLWLVIRRQLVKYSQRCFNVDSTLNYGWRDWQPNLNVVSTGQKSNANPICIFNPFSTSIQRLDDHFHDLIQRWINVVLPAGCMHAWTKKSR